ncbi:hypothetical protein Taro_026954 [Colocasia esculenta]|uniref:Uncharacterized protein n=1 Tax=Colocasia esculenta TaxID=4460 RepID=A0A843V7H0_COLES|nr:hypothetical protein [Colocasia esculenta]
MEASGTRAMPRELVAPGCASRPNAFSVALAEDIVGAVKEVCQKMTKPVPEFLVFLNDLSSNDFNSIFMGLPDFIDRMVGGEAGISEIEEEIARSDSEREE